MDDHVRRWNRVKQVFQDALERPADEHERFLHSACGDDRELRGEVESLLLAHAAAGNFAQGAAIEALAPSAAVALRDGASTDRRLQRGGRLGHYEILSAIGKGGMGEVWKARDTTLRRDVAIKMLPDAFAQDADRVARLEREATLLASLNHPNIATIHGLEADHGTRFLVLELVEGRTLADRLRRGAIPVEESLKLALQIAGALEAAHEKGVVHRDLKPANIKVTPDGRVKVLDFGLAKALASASDDVPSLTATPTEVGVIVGTPAYMSPEQARGEAVGRQADIWSFGVVLYELLTGASLFGRQTTVETLASVLGTQPDYSVLPPDTPANVRHLVRRCLEKDLKRRLRDIGDVRIEVEEALSALRTDAAPGPADVVASSRRRRRAAGAIALAALVVVIGAAAAFVWAPWRSATGAGQHGVVVIGRIERQALRPP
jgi:serine/threonine protein kinase